MNNGHGSSARRHRSLLVLVAVATALAWVLTMPATAGTDAVCVSPPPATIVAQPGVITSGTPGDDVIHGTAGDDRIAGLGGDDVLVGFGGNDQLSGGEGEDILCGGDGDDQLAGGSGDDLLSGGAGGDRLSGGEGVDSCDTGGNVGDAAAPSPSCDTIVTTTTSTTSTSTTSTSTTTTTIPGALDQGPVIFLAYADSWHDPTGGPFPALPSPWRGDPNVVFVGCSGIECGGTGTDRIQAGAIRIDNVATNANPMTLVSASVDIGPCHYHPWDELLPATANPGQSIILTQSGVLGAPMPEPCAAGMDPLLHPEHNFATAHRPGDTRTPSFYDCNPEIRHTPVINLTFADGTVLAVSDTGRVLNTGGTHSFACTSQNQATPWTGPIPY